MPLIASRCTNCGANIEIDNTKESGICEHCGAKYITEKAIKNYNTYLTQNVTKNIFGNEILEAEDYIKRADAFIKMKDYKNADEQIDKAVLIAPYDWKVWFCKIKVATKNLTDVKAHKEYVLCLEKAKAVATEKDFLELKSFCVDYEKECESYYQNIINDKQVKKSNFIAYLQKQALGFFLFLLIICLVGAFFWLSWQIFCYFPEYGLHWGYSNQHGIFHLSLSIVSIIMTISISTYTFIKKRYGKGIILLLSMLIIIGILIGIGSTASVWK